MTLGADERLIEHVQLSWCMGHFFPHTNWFETTVTRLRESSVYYLCVYNILPNSSYFILELKNSNSDIISD